MQRNLTRIVSIYLFFFFLFFSTASIATNTALLLQITGAIGPATQDYIQQGYADAEKNKANLIIITLDTPGGLDTSLREINKTILSATIPVVTFVYPSGARAASAGTYILYASPIAAMAPGTNLGAASPINIQEMSGSSKEATKSTLEKKSTNDAAAYIRSLAELYGRNKDWAESAVREAASIPAETALKLKVIDLIADNIPDLLKKINGRDVKMHNGIIKLQTTDMVVKHYPPNWRFQFLKVITDPNIAYILLLIGIYGLFFEFYNPGFMLPGVIGIIALLLALYAFQLLPVNYVGFSLLLLGIAFMIVEIFVSSFGILGIGGVIAFVIGSIFLLDTNVPGFTIAWEIIIIASLTTLAFFVLLISLAVKSMHHKIVTGREALIGTTGEVIEENNHRVLVKINGEIWEAFSKENLQKGQKVRIINIKNLSLEVQKMDSEAKNT